MSICTVSMFLVTKPRMTMSPLSLNSLDQYDAQISSIDGHNNDSQPFCFLELSAEIQKYYPQDVSRARRKANLAISGDNAQESSIVQISRATGGKYQLFDHARRYDGSAEGLIQTNAQDSVLDSGNLRV